MFEKLLPCAFCGSHAEFLDGDGNWSQIACAGCGVRGPEVPSRNEAQVVSLWNTRASPQPEAGAGVTEEEITATLREHTSISSLELQKAIWTIEVLGLTSAARAILARIAKAGQSEAGWRPIESAPKDGSAFLAWEGSERGPFKCWRHDNHQSGWWWTDHQDTEPSPTHWRPLPNHPEVDRG